MVLIWSSSTSVFSTLTLHDALPILSLQVEEGVVAPVAVPMGGVGDDDEVRPQTGEEVTGAPRHLTGADRKSTRLNSSHLVLSYAVFCLNKAQRPISSRPRKLSRR